MIMELRLFKTLWGYTGSVAEAIEDGRQSHFDGLEGPAPATASECREFHKKMTDAGLDYIAEICTAGGYVPDRRASLSEHLESLQRRAAAAAECQPLFLAVIAGCDAWSAAQSVEFFGKALEAGTEHGLTLSFETHRSRSLFNPWITRDILQQLPALKLTCDFSHWCVVCERLIDTEPDVIALCAGRAHHIHARVGYDQGPQVPHPAAPEHQDALAAHEAWWTQIWESQLARGVAISTMTPEFGPDGYMHCLPFTGAPVADPGQINTWMAGRQKRRFTELYATGSQAGTGTSDGNFLSKKIVALHHFAGIL
jgi:sugar phosphate isomerase/epimerase